MPVSISAPSAPQHSSPSPPGRNEHPSAAMTGPTLGPRPAALPSFNKKAAVTITAPTALTEKSIDASVPHPAILSTSTGGHAVTNPGLPTDPFHESVYGLIPEEYVEPGKPARYRSMFAETAKEEYKKGKKSAASMGPAKVPVPDPNEFLKKREREKGGKPPTSQPDRTIRKAPLPKEPGQIPPKTTKDFIKVNALDTINSPAKQPPPPPPSYLTKLTYGLVPPYLPRATDFSTSTPQICQTQHQKSHLKATKTTRRIRNQDLDLEPRHFSTNVNDSDSHLEMVTLPEKERLEILEGLKKNWERLNSDYQRLSLTVDTVPKIARKVNMEHQLKELEDNIHKFSHPHVMVSFGDVYRR